MESKWKFVLEHEDENWLTDLPFWGYLTTHLSDLNMHLQGENCLICAMFHTIAALKMNRVHSLANTHILLSNSCLNYKCMEFRKELMWLHWPAQNVMLQVLMKYNCYLKHTNSAAAAFFLPSSIIAFKKYF